MFVEGSPIGLMRTVGVHSLLGKLATLAQRMDFQGTAQQRELSQARYPFEKLVHLGYLYLDVMYSAASDAKQMMMRLDVAVIARNIMQERNFARFAHFAKLFENSMDRRQ